MRSAFVVLLAATMLASCKNSSTAPQTAKGIAGDWTGYAQLDTANTAPIQLSLTNSAGAISGVAIWRLSYSITGHADGNAVTLTATDATGATVYWTVAGTLSGDQFDGSVTVGAASYSATFLRQ
jgi:hypothetical protein